MHFALEKVVRFEIFMPLSSIYTTLALTQFSVHLHRLTNKPVAPTIIPHIIFSPSVTT